MLALSNPLQILAASIRPTALDKAQEAQKRFDDLIKPVGSLAKLETMVTRYAAIRATADKADFGAPARTLLLMGTDVNAAALLLAQATPVSILAEAAGAQLVPLLITSETATEAADEGALLAHEYLTDRGMGLLALGACGDAGEVTLAALTGAILQAAALGKPILLDGVATCQAALAAAELAPHTLSYCLAGHLSREDGAAELLAQLGLDAPLRLNLGGDGEGAALALTLLDAGLRAYREMETFAEAGVHAPVAAFSLPAQAEGGGDRG